MMMMAANDDDQNDDTENPNDNNDDNVYDSDDYANDDEKKKRKPTAVKRKATATANKNDGGKNGGDDDKNDNNDDDDEYDAERYFRDLHERTMDELGMGKHLTDDDIETLENPDSNIYASGSSLKQNLDFLQKSMTKSAKETRELQNAVKDMKMQQKLSTPLKKLRDYIRNIRKTGIIGKQRYAHLLNSPVQRNDLRNALYPLSRHPDMASLRPKFRGIIAILRKPPERNNTDELKRLHRFLDVNLDTIENIIDVTKYQ